MCKAYNIDRATYVSRIKKGFSIKDALLSPVRSKNIDDVQEDILFTMNDGSKAKIISYVNSRHIIIQFEDGTIRENVQLDHLRKGTVKHTGVYK